MDLRPLRRVRVAWARLRIEGGLCALLLLLPFLSPDSTNALPAGKSWSTVVDTFKIPGHTFGVQPRRMEHDEFGRPMAFVEALGGIGRDMYVLRWEDSTWTSVDHLGYGTKGVQPVPSPEGTNHLVWAGLEEIWTGRPVSYLVMNELIADTLTRPDTITTIWSASLTIGAAASSVRRWAAAGDFGDLRLFYSSSWGSWTEVPVAGRGDQSVALVALDDTTALLVWRDLDLGPGAGILRGSTWTLANPPPMTDLFDAGPRLRQRPSGGYWLSWATERDFVRIASYRDGAWSPAESIFCAYLRPEYHRAQSRAEMSRDGKEYPAISWMAVSSLNGLTSVCVCVPGDSGFTVAENLPGSEEGISPVVARDANQDVWVTWRAPSGMGWAHTFTHATASAPAIAGLGSKRVVAWTLSESAPGSWWGVLRANDSGPFEEVARLKAGHGLSMAWTDPSPCTGVYRYRVRRECMDKQYEWLTEEASWPTAVQPPAPNGNYLILTAESSNPSQTAVSFAILNASAGPLEINVYDVRGRVVARQSAIATGSGQDSFRVDLRSAALSPGTGLYFLRVVDSAGRVSPSAKFVFLQ